MREGHEHLFNNCLIGRRNTRLRVEVVSDDQLALPCEVIMMSL